MHKVIDFIKRKILKRWKDRFEYQFQRGKWDYMHSQEERPRYTAIVDLLQKHSPNGFVLDLGCGQGILASQIPHATYTYCGIDFSQTAINQASQKNISHTTFCVADVDKYIPDKPYNAIIFNEVLYYLPHPHKTIERYAKYLSSNGIFIFSLFVTKKHLILWDALVSHFKCIESSQTTNEHGTKWNSGVFVLTSKVLS